MFAQLPVQADAAEPAWSPSDGEQLSFEVLRNGRPFGDHVVTFDREGEGVLVDVDIDLRVRFGPITAFRYEHDIEERWRDGALQSLEANTLKDGERFDLAVTRSGDGLAIEGREFTGVAEDPLIPTTYWNIALIEQSRMLNSETGALLPLDVELVGQEQIVAGGETIGARRYLLRSEIDLELWYDDAGRWVKCAFTTRGSRIEYVLR
ncbi:MAG: DUF6134 family protein [Maricaulaceae bacterium]